MNITNFLETIQEIASQVKTVRSSLIGDATKLWNTGEIEYASFVVGIRNVEKEENVRSYNIVLYYGDRLLTDMSNRISIYDDATNTLQTVINKLDSLDGIDVNEDYTIELYEENFGDKMADVLAGGYVLLQVSVEDELGNCEMNDITTPDEDLIERLLEMIRKYQEEDAELAVLLTTIKHKLDGTEI